ncbi:MAG TPA: oligosaccharide flippase family protein, partial [Firmicutes bacterium]|nr:oligosaccharide flippase family protein [Bacillota bacterium]
MRRQSFVRGALILTVAGFAVRFIGAGFRIILARIIGDEGIGLYQVAYPVYSTLLAISTAGVPIAISKLVSQYLSVGDYRGARRVFTLAVKILAVSGFVISVAMYLNAGLIAERIAQDTRAYYP